MISQERFLALLDKYIVNTISEEERTELFLHINSDTYDDIVSRHIDARLAEKTVSGANLPPHRSAEMMHNILLSEKQTSRLIPGLFAKRKPMRWAAAAALLFCIAAMAGYFITGRNKNTTRIAAIATNMQERANTSHQPQRVEMEDGSVVTLQPGAIISYPDHFKTDKREVALEGEAFFEVSKNPESPFYVYDDSIVTHVLGTSFNIKRDPATRQLEVSVRTGKVEVFERRPAGSSNAGRKSNGVILLANQKVVYDGNNRQFVSSLVDNPLPVGQETGRKTDSAESFVFEEASLAKVLAAIEKVYKIEMVVENEKIYECLFTGDITTQALYSKLDIICESIHASYEIKGTQILIKGKGCK